MQMQAAALRTQPLYMGYVLALPGKLPSASHSLIMFPNKWIEVGIKDSSEWELVPTNSALNNIFSNMLWQS